MGTGPPAATGPTDDMTEAFDSVPRSAAVHGANVPGPYRQIVWDWNGTLLDDVQASVNAINVLLMERRLPTIDQASYRDIFGFPVRNFYLALGFHLERENWDALARQYHDLYLADPSIRLWPEAIPVLRTCHAAGLGMSILSAAEQSILDRMLEDAGISAWFARIHGVDNLNGHSKLDIGRAFMSSLDCPRSHVLFVGDTLHDHEVAMALGCACVLVSHGHQSQTRLIQSGCPVLQRLADLPEFLKSSGTHHEV